MAKQKTQQAAPSPDAKARLKEKILAKLKIVDPDKTVYPTKETTYAPEDYAGRSLSGDTMLADDARIQYKTRESVPAQEDMMQQTDMYGNVSKQRVPVQPGQINTYVNDRAQWDAAAKRMEINNQAKRKRGEPVLEDLISARAKS